MKNTRLSFEEIYDYLTNNLSCDRMRQVEHSIISNKESESVYHTMMFDYRYNKDYIESLIGTDDEENENNSEKNRQNFANSTLKKRKNKKLNKLKIMEKLNGVNLPKNMDQVMTAVENLKPAIIEMLEAKEVDHVAAAQAILVKRYGMAEQTAQEVVDDLMSGIDEFDARFEAMKHNDLTSVQANVETLLDGRTEVEKKNLLVNSLVALKSLQEEMADDKTIEAKIQEYNAKSYDELLAEFEQALLDDSSFADLVNTFGQSLNEPTAQQLAEYRKQLNCNTKENKLYTALALYIAQCDGEIDLAVDEKGVDAETIGACAAAAVAVTLATAQLQTGEIDKPTWMKWMKCIFAGLFCVSMIIAASILIASTGVMVVLGLMALFGQGIIATFISLAVAFVVVKYLVDKSIEAIGWITEALEKPYDYVVDKVVCFVGWMADWVKGKLWQKAAQTGAEPKKAQEPTEQITVQQDTPTRTVENNEHEEPRLQTLSPLA